MPCAPGMRECAQTCLHRQLVRQYHDARDARDRLRESAAPAPASVAGAAHCAIGFHQLSDAEFRQAVPPVLFKQWLLDHARPTD